MKIPIEKIKPNPQQPRRVFPQGSLEELARSIKETGLIQPIVVEKNPQNGGYILVDGERRLRASIMAGFTSIEAFIQDDARKDEKTRLIEALTANLQREDLTLLEEAEAYLQLHKAGLSHTRLALLMGKSTPYILSRLKVLEMDIEIQDLVGQGLLPTDLRVSKALLSVKDRNDRIRLAKRLARPGIRIATIERACTTYNQVVRGKEEMDDVPVLSLQKTMSLPRWDLLAEVGVMPPWALLCDAARKTCEHCSLKDIASRAVCGECPAVQLVTKLIDMSEKE